MCSGGEKINNSDRGLRVAIVGGGMCGLAVAIGLMKADVDIDIYEAGPKLGEIGAGVGLDSNAFRVLQELGILDSILSSVHPEIPKTRPILTLSGLGEHELIYDYPANPEDVGIGIHRAIFLDTLYQLIDPSKIHFNKRCTGLRIGQANTSQRTQIIFSDGTTAEADVILGADGVRSVVRVFVLEETTSKIDGEGGSSIPSGNSSQGEDKGLKPVRVSFTNTLAYRGLVPVEQLKKVGMSIDLSTRPHSFTGLGKHIITFPIKNGTVINVVAFTCDRSIPWSSTPLPQRKWVTPRSTPELLDTYAGWGRDVLLLLGCMASPSVWAVHAIDPPLDSYVSGRVALLGDAAHAMLPHLGAGAGQGMEDVLVLVKLLGHPQTSRANVEDVLKAYDAIRRPRANMVLMESTKIGNVYEGFGPSGDSIEGMRKDLFGVWDKIWYHDIMKDVKAAVISLVEAGVFRE